MFAVLLKTDRGLYLFGNIQCSNGCYFNANGCFEYCKEKNDSLEKLQADKLIYNSTLLGKGKNNDKYWYKDKDNFIDVEIKVPEDIKNLYTQDYLDD